MEDEPLERAPPRKSVAVALAARSPIAAEVGRQRRPFRERRGLGGSDVAVGGRRCLASALSSSPNTRHDPSPIRHGVVSPSSCAAVAISNSVQSAETTYIPKADYGLLSS